MFMLLCCTQAGATPAPEPEAKLPSGEEPRVDIEVAYPARSELLPLAADADVSTALRSSLEGCSSRDWAENVQALGQLRRVLAHHAADVKLQLQPIVTAVLGHVRSLRSAVSKTAILAAADLLISFGDEMGPLMDVGALERPASSLLHQLLLKASSNEKRFVVDAASDTLQVRPQAIAYVLQSSQI